MLSVARSGHSYASPFQLLMPFSAATLLRKSFLYFILFGLNLDFFSDTQHTCKHVSGAKKSHITPWDVQGRSDKLRCSLSPLMLQTAGGLAGFRVQQWHSACAVSKCVYSRNHMVRNIL